MIELEVDELKLYFGGEYKINNKISIFQPTVGQIVDYGESSYFSMVHTLSAIPSEMKSQLWDEMGLDWNKLEDFDLFILLAKTLDVSKTQILFKDFDFQKLSPYKNNQNDEIVLANIEEDIIVDKMIYMRIMNYIRKLHNITPKVEKAANKDTKMVLLEEDRQNIALAKNKPFKSYLLPLISSVKVKQGYTKEYVRNMGLYEFFDDLRRMQLIDSASHLLNGVYAGTIDTQKINKSELNWLKEL